VKVAGSDDAGQVPDGVGLPVEADRGVHVPDAAGASLWIASAVHRRLVVWHCHSQPMPTGSDARHPFTG
jgi:hypothetical protein